MGNKANKDNYTQGDQKTDFYTFSLIQQYTTKSDVAYALHYDCHIIFTKIKTTNFCQD